MVDFSGLYYKAAESKPLDFRPMQQAAEAQAESIRDAAKSIALGIYKRREYGIEEKKLAVDEAFRKAQQLHEQRMENYLSGRVEAMKGETEAKTERSAASDASRERRTGLSIAAKEDIADKNNATKRDLAKEANDLNAAQGEAAGRQLGLPPGAGALLGIKHITGVLRQKFQEKKAADAKAAQDEHKADVIGDLDAALGNKTITKEEHAGAMSHVHAGNLNAAASVLHGAADKVSDRDKAGYIRSAGETAFKKRGDEALAAGDHEKADELYDAASSMANYIGDAKSTSTLYRELVAKHQPKAPTPKMTLPSGKQVPDPLGLARGGNNEDLTLEQRTALTGLGQAEAKSDGRWKAIDLEEAALRGAATADKPVDPAKLQELQNRRNLLIVEYGNRIGTMNGWHPTGKPVAGGQAAPQDKAGAAQSIRQRISAGEFGHEGNFDEEKLKSEMDAAGVSEEDVMGAGGGG